MVKLHILVALLTVALASALPKTPEIPVRSTVFADEKLEGGPFEIPLQSSEDADIVTLNAPLNAYRLPETTMPTHYNVFWQVDVASVNRSMSGNVEISLRATQADVSEIVIHYHELEFGNGDVVLRLGNTVIPSNIVRETQYNFLRIVLESGYLQYNAEIPVIYTLTIDFSADLRSDMYGIYESWYRNNYSDEVSWMASTQFQATAGRSAFPCYDEPKFKATFDVTIRRPVGYSSWFCTRLSETINAVPDFQDDVYTRTPVMSTYLLALIVADYASIPSNDANGNLMYEVIARPAAIQNGQGQYAFEVGMQLLDRMSAHTGIDYYSHSENLKMTQAAIPDFSAGAMENWGLLTYREAYLMYSDDHTNSNYKQLIAYILSHEIAHMWFGNLVTCHSWDYLWLNEGFARYYQYFLTNWIETNMGFETRFITEQVHTALLSDSVDNAHPLNVPSPGTSTKASVSAVFSLISYNKGAAVIRMTEHLLGFNVHEEGLQNYLAAKSYETAIPIDLFNALQNVSIERGAISEYGSDFNIVDYYRSWSDQSGHPVLNVQVDHETGRMTVTQRRFNINQGVSNINTNYIVPITFATASNPDFTDTKPTHILSQSLGTIDRGSIGQEWVIFNKQQTGYYRVNYDDVTWDLITLALRGPDRLLIHEYNRAQIVNDVFQFARSGLMTYRKAMNILSFLEFETDYAPWVAAMTGFTWIRNRYAGTAFLTTLNGLIQNWATALMTDLTYYPPANVEEDFMRSYLRLVIAPIMCNMDNQECRNAARLQFRQLADNGVEVPVDSRNWVYCSTLRDGNPEDFEFLWQRFIEHPVYTEKILLLSTLGCTTHTESLHKYLAAIIDDEYLIRRQDYATAWASAFGDETNTQRVFQFVQENLDDVIAGWNGNAFTPISGIASRLRSNAEINAFQQWLTAHQTALWSSFNNLNILAEDSRNSIQWAANNQEEFGQFIENGLDDIVLPTPVPVETEEIIIIEQPVLVEPAEPVITDAAVTSIVSALLLSVALFAHFIM